MCTTYPSISALVASIKIFIHPILRFARRQLWAATPNGLMGKVPFVK